MEKRFSTLARAGVVAVIVGLTISAAPAAQAHGNAPVPKAGSKAEKEYHRLAGSMVADRPITIARAVLNTYGPYVGTAGRRERIRQGVIFTLDKMNTNGNATYAQKKCVRDEVLHLSRHLYQAKMQAETMTRLFNFAEKAAKKSTKAGPTYVTSEFMQEYARIGKAAIKAANKQVADNFAYESTLTLQACFDFA